MKTVIIEGKEVTFEPKTDEEVFEAFKTYLADRIKNSSYGQYVHAVALQTVLFPSIRRCACVRLGISASIRRLKSKGLIVNFRDRKGVYVLADK